MQPLAWTGEAGDSPGTGEYRREIVVMPSKAVVRYTVPMAGDSDTPGSDSEELIVGGRRVWAAACPNTGIPLDVVTDKPLDFSSEG